MVNDFNSINNEIGQFSLLILNSNLILQLFNLFQTIFIEVYVYVGYKLLIKIYNLVFVKIYIFIVKYDLIYIYFYIFFDELKNYSPCYNNNDSK